LLQITHSGSRAYTERNGLPDDEVFALAQAPDHSIWIGTNDGITRLRGGEFSAYRTRDGLSHSQVLSLFVDREGTLWAGTKDGLDQFTDGKLTPYTTAEGLRSNEVGPILEDGAHRLWIGTLDAGLEYFDGRGFHSLSRREGLVSDQILSLALDSRGNIWAGTKGGINRIDNGRVVATLTAGDGLSSPEVRTLFVDSEGMLWAGTARGLDRFDGRKFVPELMDEDNRHAGVVALGGDRKVRLFASFEGPSLAALANGHVSSHPLDNVNAVDAFFVDPSGHTVWMATLGSGLVRWKDGAIAHVHVKDGLYDNRLYSILSDNDGHFWLASSKGIFRLNRQELEDFADGKRGSVSSLPFSTGQLRFECRSGVQPAAARSHDGRLWFSTTTV
jgi:ligand-binding sensor domain-containing protein